MQRRSLIFFEKQLIPKVPCMATQTDALGGLRLSIALDRAIKT